MYSSQLIITLALAIRHYQRRRITLRFQAVSSGIQFRPPGNAAKSRSGSSSGKAAFADFVISHVLVPKLRPGPGTPWAITRVETRCGIKIDALLPDDGHEPPTTYEQ